MHVTMNDSNQITLHHNSLFLDFFSTRKQLSPSRRIERNNREHPIARPDPIPVVMVHMHWIQ